MHPATKSRSAVVEPASVPVHGSVRRAPRGTTYLAVKRTIDLVVGSLALVVSLPLLGLISVAIWLDSGAPIVFRQRRIGRHGASFECLKFRTMVPDAEQRLEALLAEDASARREYELTWKLSDDPRVTRVGKLLRRTSLDELPQVWNVLRGEMSLVGPRPPLPDEITWFGDAIGTVLGVRPGITGLWQISGRSDLPYTRRVALDYEYAVHHHTLRGDLRILLITAAVVLTRRGAC